MGCSGIHPVLEEMGMDHRHLNFLLVVRIQCSVLFSSVFIIVFHFALGVYLVLLSASDTFLTEKMRA